MLRHLVKNVPVKSLLFAAAAAFGAQASIANNPATTVTINNTTGAPVTVTVSDAGCYGGDKGAKTIGPGKSWGFSALSVCSNHAFFNLTFSKKDSNDNAVAAMGIDKKGIVWQTPKPNGYGGELSPGPSGYLYTMVAGVPPLRGYWDMLCQPGTCRGLTVISGIESAAGTENSASSTKVVASFKASGEAAWSKGKAGGSMEGSATSDSRTEATKNIVNQITSEKRKVSYGEFTSGHMSKNGIAAVWQWKITNGTYTFATNKITCTRSLKEPSWEFDEKPNACGF